HGVLDQVHGEGGLAHRRTAGNDDQVRRLQAAGLVVEIGVTGGQAGDGIGSVEQGVDAVDGLGQQIVDPDRAAGLRPRLGDLEDLPLGLVEYFGGGAPLRVEGGVGDGAADTDQLTQGGALANDLRVGLDVGH